MKVIEETLPEKKKGRLFIAIGDDEISLLYDALAATSRNFPDTRFPQEYKRMKQMQRELGLYLGRKKAKPAKTSDFPCPQCPAYLRDEAGIAKHVKTIHTGDNHHEPIVL